MKKFIALIMVCLICFTMIGCNKNPSADSIFSEVSSGIIVEEIIPETYVSIEETTTVESDEETLNTLSHDSSNTSSTEEEKLSFNSVSSLQPSNSSIVEDSTIVSPSEVESTIIENNSWFEKHGFSITPIAQKFCFNDDVNHMCPDDLVIEIVEGTTDIWESSECADGYKNITFRVSGTLWKECTGMNIVAFDRYNGTAFGYQSVEFNLNSKKIKITERSSLGHSGFFDEINCPIDYDGIVFVATNMLSFPENYKDGDIHTIDEFIDFNTAEYYFYSLTDK